MDLDLTSAPFVFTYVVAAVAALLGGWLFYRATTMKREDEDPRPDRPRSRRDGGGGTRS